MRGQIGATQYDTLMKPLNSTRIAKRTQGGKQLSYLESWDVRAHLIRVFGFGNFDSEIEECSLAYIRDVAIGKSEAKPEGTPGIDVGYLVRLRLTIYDPDGTAIATYVEAAVGSATGSVNYGDLHDNAVKQGASDALKRCAINLGSQFGLSLYDNGTTREVVRGTLVHPKDWTAPVKDEAAGGDVSAEAQAALENTLGATVVSETLDQAADQADVGRDAEPTDQQPEATT